MATLLINIAIRLGLILPFDRIEEAPCPPLVLADLSSFESFHRMLSEARTRLRVLITVSYVLAHLVDVFIDTGLVKDESPKAVYFVRGTYFYAHRLIFHSFNFYTEQIGSNFDASELPQEFRNIFDQTETAIRSLKSSLEALDGAIQTDGWSLDLTTLPSAALVPTACPCQLFMEAFVATSVAIAAAVSASQDDADLILKIADILAGLPVPQQARSKKAGDAQPKTTAIYPYHDDFRVERVLIGCSGADWKGFSEIAGVVKELRMIRLRNYHALGVKAFNAQEAIEIRRRKENGSEGENPDGDLLWEARKGTIEEMEGDESFLGRKSFFGRKKDDVCGAFSTPSWAYKIACYICKGTLGYREAEAETAGEDARRDDSRRYK